MTKLLGGSAFSILLASLALAGCAGDGSGEGAPPAPPPVAAPAAPGAHTVVGSYVAHVRPRENRIDLAPLRKDLAGQGAVTAQGLTNASIVSDGMPSSGPAYTVELDTTTTTDTFGTGASGSCPAGEFCGDVTFTHFFTGLNLSAVYAQVTGITDSSGTIITNHNAMNGVASTPFGVDLTYGAWSYTDSMATLAYGAPATQTWAFANPDDSDFYVYLDVYAALYPMMWFDTGAITQTAPLVAGQPAIVHYMYARNSGCQGANASVQGFLKGANIDIHTTSWTGVAGATYFDQQVIMPFGSGLDFWFDNTASGCTSPDSNGGSNFNYGISNVSNAIHFAGPNASTPPYATGNWNVSQDGGLKGGATFTVDYEVDRAGCVTLDQYGRVPSGTTLVMGYSFDGGSYNTVTLLGLPYGVPSSINGLSGQVYVPPTIAIPEGSQNVTVYFQSTAPGCPVSQEYDSNFGHNYTISY